MLELARHDAQGLHEKIGDTIADGEHATWADLEAVKADIMALSAKMASVAEGQSASVTSGLLTAIAGWTCPRYYEPIYT